MIEIDSTYSWDALAALGTFYYEFEGLDMYITKMMSRCIDHLIPLWNDSFKFDKLYAVDKIIEQLSKMNKRLGGCYVLNKFDPDYFTNLIAQFKGTYDRIAQEIANESLETNK